MDKSAFTNSEKERLLAYAAGFISSTIANPHYTQGSVQPWLMKRSIKAAKELIETIFDDAKLEEVLKDG